MPRIAIRHAHKLAYRRRLSLGPRMLGCLVMLAGAIVMAAALAEAAKGQSSREALLMIVFGPLLFAAGATLFCGERGLLIDRETRTLKRWWSVIVPLWRTLDDISQYQAAGCCLNADTALPRWRVCLFNAQGERIELFELAEEEVAEFAARQVAGFLSLPLARPPAAAVVDRTVATTAEAGAPPRDVSPAGAVWSYRRHFGLLPRGMGIVCFVLGLVLGIGLAGANNLGSNRWLVVIAAAAPLCLAGLWLFAGGRRVLVDAEDQSVKLWHAWPLPPAIYELSAFYAVLVAPENAAPSDVEPPPHLIGLVGAEQFRLEMIRGLSRDEALAAATELATVVRLPLVDEPAPVEAARPA